MFGGKQPTYATLRDFAQLHDLSLITMRSLWGGSILMGEIKVDDTKDKNNT